MIMSMVGLNGSRSDVYLCAVKRTTNMATANKDLPRSEYSEIEVRPVAGNLGAEINGVDLQNPLSDNVYAEIHQALLQYLVIFFRDQDITPEQQKDFGRRFGELHIHPYIPNLEGHPEIIALRSAETGPAEMSYQSNQWHTDLTYIQEPPMASMLWGSAVATGRWGHHVSEPLPGIRYTVAENAGIRVRPDSNP